MNLTARFLIAFFSLVLVGSYVFYDTVTSQIELGISQSTEETMVDTANLLAEIIEEEFAQGEMTLAHLERATSGYTTRTLNAAISDVIKTQPSFRIYVTDDKGIVIFDSQDTDVGEDYSQWNDVYLTLRGEYGARATRLDAADESTTVLHVAAPIRLDDAIVGVVTVAKSKLSLLPYVERIRDTMVKNGLLLLVLSLGVCLLLAFWLTRSIRTLVSYADNVVGENAKTGPLSPGFSEPEFRQLSEAMQAMRNRLDGKEYVESYIDSLTHEIKSPVAAIKGALELMDGEMPAADRERFLDNVHHEIDRLEAIADRLLQLAELEHKQALDQTEDIDLEAILQEQVAARAIQFQEKQIAVVQHYEPASVAGDSFLLKQAINNLLDNALTHAPADSELVITLSSDQSITIRDQGPGIPEYAVDKVFDRFFSLPHPVTGKKSTGLGLSFVKQILTLHDAEITLANENPGVTVKITFSHTKTT